MYTLVKLKKKSFHQLRTFFVNVFFVFFICICCLITAQAQRLNDSRIRFTAISEFLQREFIIVIFIHLIENFIDALLRCIFIFRLRLLSLSTEIAKKQQKKEKSVIKYGNSFELITGYVVKIWFVSNPSRK